MPDTHERNRAIIDVLPAAGERPSVTYRYAGDRFILVEYGEMVLDLTMNFRIFGLNDALKRAGLPGLIETVPALRSILIHYDSRRLPTRELTGTLKKLEDSVPPGENLNIPSRRVELPIAFADRWTRADIERYVKYTRQDAPNIVDGHNIEYIAQYNGLRSPQEVVEYICSTEWWNACIGFWPGLPFMFPLDPRYAIVTPKYNPTRPWTPEGAVGIGGPCVAIYPVESPGGYQLFGRTIPVFDLKQRNPAFKANPILLKPADRIQWVPVSDEQLETIRAQVHDGTYRYKVVSYEALNVRSYLAFLDSIKSEVKAFQHRQAEAVKHVKIP
jgi:KipI family sensor histidine kinase inhibitor